MKCIRCDKEAKTVKNMPNNYDGFVDVTFHAHYGSRHDMCMVKEEDLVRQTSGVICDDCYTEVKGNE